MLKILQARLHQHLNSELQDVQAGFRKGRGTRDQIANIHWTIEKAREFQKNIYFCFIDYVKAFDFVQFSSVAQSCPTRWDPMDHSILGFTVHHQLPELTQTHVYRVSDAIQPSCPLSSPSPPSFNLSSIRVFSNELVLHIRWLKYWSFSFSISPSNEYSGLISFRIDWLDLLAVQGNLRKLLEHHSAKISVLQKSAFFIVQHSHSYMTTEKTVAFF